MDEALAAARPQPVDLGGLMDEQASAMRLVMTVAQIAKHVDASQPVRFLVAETESGYTLLAALLLARLCGVEDRGRDQPALRDRRGAGARGERVVEEALRSPHWRAHLRSVGRLCLQFGYSDSGRYIGQVAASHLIERLKLRVADLLAQHGLADLEVVLFDTHGESLGRGGHPDGLPDRFAYLDPPAVRAAFARHGIRTRVETSFQGGDGYLNFGTPALAHAAVARIAEHAFAPAGAEAAPDPVYAESGFAADLFAGARAAMEALVEDPGYGALLGAFGPALLDRTGSRPTARQSDGGGPVEIRHPREMRAIPNNAVLQQLGFLADLTHGLGDAASREPETPRRAAPRAARASPAPWPSRAPRCRSPTSDVLRGYVASLDPGMWLDRAARTRRPGRAAELTAVARALERLGPRRSGARRVPPPARRPRWRCARPGPARRRACPDRLFAVHAVRLCLIHRVWLLAVGVPDFSPRHSVTREGLLRRLLRLDVAGATALLDKVFPSGPPPDAGLDFAEPPAPRRAGYGREHAELVRAAPRAFRRHPGSQRRCLAECGAVGIRAPQASEVMSRETCGAPSSAQTAAICSSQRSAKPPSAALSRNFASISRSLSGFSRLPRAAVTVSLTSRPSARRTVTLAAPRGRLSSSSAEDLRPERGQRRIDDRRHLEIGDAGAPAHQPEGRAMVDADPRIALVPHRAVAAREQQRRRPRPSRRRSPREAPRSPAHPQASVDHRVENDVRRDRVCRCCARSPTACRAPP